MSIKKLQQELAARILDVITESSDDIVENAKERAVEITNELKDHINDDIEVSENIRMTVLDFIVHCKKIKITQKLMNLENAVENIGGKTSQELGREENVEELQNIDIEDIRNYIVGMISHHNEICNSVRQFELIVKEQEKSSRHFQMDFGFYTGFSCTIGGALIGSRLAKRFETNKMSGGMLGALTAIVVAGIPLLLFSKKNSASTNLRDTTTAQLNEQGIEPIIR